MDEDLSPDQQAAVDTAVGDAVHATDPGDVVLGYLLLVETLDAETGERALITRGDSDAAPWTMMGRLEYVRQLLASEVGD